MMRVGRVAWYRFRATFGRRLGGYLSLVLLVALVGGLSMGALAAARRTQSSFATYLASTNPSNLGITVFGGVGNGGGPDGGAEPGAATLHLRRSRLRRKIGPARVMPMGQAEQIDCEDSPVADLRQLMKWRGPAHSV